MKFVDIHTHAAWDPEIIQIKDISQESLDEIKREPFYSLGIHPWFIQANSLDMNLQRIEDQINDNSFLAIGECGLDKVCNTDFSLQFDTFKRQVLLSEKHEKPMILHIVKAFNELIQIRHESKAKQAWIIHGFIGSSQLVKQLTDLGIFISFGVNKGSPKVRKSLQSTPINRLFLETDASKAAIESVYESASKDLNFSVYSLKMQLYLNFQTLFL